MWTTTDWKRWNLSDSAELPGYFVSSANHWMFLLESLIIMTNMSLKQNMFQKIWDFKEVI